jgi:hypothetical protein
MVVFISISALTGCLFITTGMITIAIGMIGTITIGVIGIMTIEATGTIDTNEFSIYSGSDERDIGSATT